MGFFKRAVEKGKSILNKSREIGKSVLGSVSRGAKWVGDAAKKVGEKVGLVNSTLEKADDYFKDIPGVGAFVDAATDIVQKPSEAISDTANSVGNYAKKAGDLAAKGQKFL